MRDRMGRGDGVARWILGTATAGALVATLLAAVLSGPAGAQVVAPTSPILAAPNGYLADADDPTWKPVAALPSGSGPAWQSWIPPTYASPGPGAKKGDDWVAFELEGARPAPVAVADARATYREVLPGVDASYLSGPAGISELLVLNGRTPPSRYAFRVKTNEGLSARKASDGSIRFSNAAGAERFSFAKPFMFDASGTEDGVSTKVEQGLERVSGGYRVTLTADETWLRSERRQGPIVLDPTVNLDPARQSCTTPLALSPTDPTFASKSYAYALDPTCRPTRQAELAALPACDLTATAAPSTGCYDPTYYQNVYLPSLVTYLTSPLVTSPPSSQPPPAPPVGRYRVSSCSHTPAKVNRAFVGSTAGVGYRVSDLCGTGGALEQRTTGSNASSGANAVWGLSAPAGTTLRTADYYVRGGRTYRAGVKTYFETDKALLEGCYADIDPPCDFSTGYAGSKTDVALGGASVIRLVTRCDANPCDPARAENFIYGATVEVDDPQAPTVTPKGGTLFTQNRQTRAAHGRRPAFRPHAK